MLKPIIVERISAPDRNKFFADYLHKSIPVVMSGVVDSWPAFRKWDLAYFANNFGSIDAGALKIKGAECDINTYRGSKLDNNTVGKVIDSIQNGILDGGFVLAAPVQDFPSELKHDYEAPIYCHDGAFLRSRLFIGPSGTITSLHQDLPENLYVMLKGKKRITLFPPPSPVYPNSRFSKLPNHAKADVKYPDYAKYPDFKYAQPYLVEIEAGDTLFIPSLWWHHFENVETSIALNFWWSYGWKLPIAWLAAFYKKLRDI